MAESAAEINKAVVVSDPTASTMLYAMVVLLWSCSTSAMSVVDELVWTASVSSRILIGERYLECQLCWAAYQYLFSFLRELIFVSNAKNEDILGAGVESH